MKVTPKDILALTEPTKGQLDSLRIGYTIAIIFMSSI